MQGRESETLRRVIVSNEAEQRGVGRLCLKPALQSNQMFDSKTPTQPLYPMFEPDVNSST